MLGGSKINKEWHLAHKMPKNPTLEQRLEWHYHHSQQCHCREVPESLKAAIKKYLAQKMKK